MVGDISYSHSLRVLACGACGAPVEVALGGGRFACSYCGADNRLAARDESGDLARALAPPTTSESERYTRLREQAGVGRSLPASLEPLTRGGELAAERVDEARSAWRTAREHLVATPSFPLSERLFYLTVLLAPHVELRAQRAFLETAIELLPDEGHRHILRCMFSRLAVRSGEPDAAEKWLAPCDPRSLDLPMDTAYRYAAATLATARGQYDEVLSLLGTRSGDVPLAEPDLVPCTLLRIHALEKQGELREAADSLAELKAAIGSLEVQEALRDSVPVRLCSGAFRELSKRELEERVSALEGEITARTSRPALRFLLRLGYLAVVTAAIAALLSDALTVRYSVLPAMLFAVLTLLAILVVGARARARLRVELADVRSELAGLHGTPPKEARS